MFKYLELQTKRCNRRYRIRGRIFIFVVLAIAWTGIIHAQDEGYYITKGRVVDRNGNGFPDAGICLEPVVYESQAFDRFVECIGTDSDGRFAIKKIKNESTIGKRYFLFVSVDGTDALSTITPPFDLVRHFDKSFDGREIVLGSKSLIDVGDVSVQFWYGAVTLDFSRSEFKDSKKGIDWPSASLRILNQAGNVSFFSTLSKDDIARYVKYNGFKLSIALPEGKWKVEIRASSGKRLVAYSSYFFVKRNSERSVKMTTSP